MQIAAFITKHPDAKNKEIIAFCAGELNEGTWRALWKRTVLASRVELSESWEKIAADLRNATRPLLFGMGGDQYLQHMTGLVRAAMERYDDDLKAHVLSELQSELPSAASNLYVT